MLDVTAWDGAQVLAWAHDFLSETHKKNIIQVFAKKAREVKA
jgi:hypothetical protein